MEFSKVSADKVPISLLKEADPDESKIASYLSEGWCFIAKKQHEVLAACIVYQVQDRAEVCNISVNPDHQGEGIGSKLLRYVLSQLKGTDVNWAVLGTGSFGHQLTFYQRIGFRVDKVEKDYFLKNYTDPIYELGIQHKDRLWLTLDLNSWSI